MAKLDEFRVLSLCEMPASGKAENPQHAAAQRLSKHVAQRGTEIEFIWLGTTTQLRIVMIRQLQLEGEMFPETIDERGGEIVVVLA